MQIQIEDLHFAYPGGVNALNGISMIIQPGEKLALVGENGSGKTTLARHLNGLLRPQSGHIMVGDWQTSEHSPAQMARRVAYAFQNPDEQLFRQRVWDEVAFGPQNLGFPPERIRVMVDQAIEWMGLIDLAHLNPRDLGFSGRKRVALASTLAMQSPVLILDEPTAGLDAQEQEQLGQVIASQQQQGKTIIVITHDMDFIAEHLERGVLLHQGRVVLDEPTKQFFGHKELLEKTGLAAPQITRLSEFLGHSILALNVEDFLSEERTRNR